MLSWAVTFFVIALIAAVLGFSGIAGTAVNIAWILAVIGIILAIVFAVPPIASLFMKKEIPVQVEPYSIFVSLAVAIFVGVFAGLYPAWRASHLDPIEALRHN